jgi:hypothetical protein
MVCRSAIQIVADVTRMRKISAGSLLVFCTYQGTAMAASASWRSQEPPGCGHDTGSRISEAIEALPLCLALFTQASCSLPAPEFSLLPVFDQLCTAAYADRVRPISTLTPILRKPLYRTRACCRSPLHIGLWCPCRRWQRDGA